VGNYILSIGSKIIVLCVLLCEGLSVGKCVVADTCALLIQTRVKWKLKGSLESHLVLL